MAAFYGLTRFAVWTLVIVGLFVGVLRLTIFRWVRLPSDDPVLRASTMPTLDGGDLILTWRITDPIFGDLVLCPEPEHTERFVIGRIIGEEGDKVVIKDNVPVVNNRPFIVERGCDPGTFTMLHPDRDSEEITQHCDWEAIANKLHMAGSLGGHVVRPMEQTYEVPQGHWFLISDNRLFPYDSRDYGYVDKSTCRETVVGRLVSGKGWKDSKNRLTFIQ